MTRFHPHLILSLILLAAGVARADVVGPEPNTCPPGSRASTCHGGPHCATLACETDSECENGLSCREVSACIGTVNCAGLLPPGEDPRMYDRDTLEGRCENSAPCPTDSTCKTVRLCMSAASGSGGAPPTNGAGGGPPANGAGGGDVVTKPVGDSGSDGGCSCKVAAANAPESALWLSLSLALATFARRRRRAS